MRFQKEIRLVAKMRTHMCCRNLGGGETQATVVHLVHLEPLY